jgi:hypothetical protein
VVKLKFAGVVSEYKDAVEIENIVKVFLIKKRINDLISLDKRKNFEKLNSNVDTISIDDIKYLNNSDEKILHNKIYTDSQSIFCVRGFV